MAFIVKQINTSDQGTEVTRFEERADAVCYIEDLIGTFEHSGYCDEDDRWWARNGTDTANNLTFVVVGSE